MSVTSMPRAREPLCAGTPDDLSSPSIHMLAPPVPSVWNECLKSRLSVAELVLVTVSKSVWAFTVRPAGKLLVGAGDACTGAGVGSGAGSGVVTAGAGATGSCTGAGVCTGAGGTTSAGAAESVGM